MGTKMASIAAEQSPCIEVDSAGPLGDERLYVMLSMANFALEHKSLKGPSNRAPLALALTAELRTGLEQSDDSSRLQDNSRSQLRTQVDVMEWLAWNDLWYYHDSDAVEIPGIPGPRLIREEEFASKERVFEDIGLHHSLSVGSEDQAYDNLLNNFYLARLVVQNPQGLMAQEKRMDRAALAQMLSVYRMISGLQRSGFSRARRPTLSEKGLRKIDAVVPVGRIGKRLIPIRVQPGSRATGGVETCTMGKSLLANVPYYDCFVNPFVMMKEDRETVTRAVAGERERIYAGFALQTEVNKVESPTEQN